MSDERMLAYIKKFYEVREDVQKRLEEMAKENEDLSKMSGADFEDVVYKSLIHIGFDKDSITHSSQKFPDFVIKDKNGNKIGMEVKKTNSSKWEVIGGSIYESVKNDIKDLYLIIAKIGGEKPEVRLRKYKECIADLKVTHRPRFYLNADLKEGQNYLTQNDANDLFQLSGDELNRKVRKLLRTQKSTWWSESETIAFSDLSKEEKEIYLNEGIALFPEVFKGDYQKFTPWLVYNCFVWCGNVRDIFSAGGVGYIDDIEMYVSAVMYRACKNMDSVKRRIVDMTEEEQIKFWGQKANDVDKRIGLWIKLVEKNIRVSTDLLHHNKKIEKYKDKDDNQLCKLIKIEYIELLKTKLRENKP